MNTIFKFKARYSIWGLGFAVVALAALLFGCTPEAQVTQYEVAKPPSELTAAPQAQVAKAPAQTQRPANMALSPELAQQTAQFTTPKWTVPANWKAEPLGSMRKGSWSISGHEQYAEVSVLAFPGTVGGVTANINRWRGQIGLPPESTELVQQQLEPITIGPRQRFCWQYFTQ